MVSRYEEAYLAKCLNRIGNLSSNPNEADMNPSDLLPAVAK